MQLIAQRFFNIGFDTTWFGRNLDLRHFSASRGIGFHLFIVEEQNHFLHWIKKGDTISWQDLHGRAVR
jgi:hypothetical protein